MQKKEEPFAGKVPHFKIKNEKYLSGDHYFLSHHFRRLLIRQGQWAQMVPHTEL